MYSIVSLGLVQTRLNRCHTTFQILRIVRGSQLPRKYYSTESSRMSSISGSDYSEWTREDLIKRIQTLEHNLQKAAVPTTTSTEQLVTSVPKRSSSTEQSRKSNKKARAFNFSSHATHKVAFKISYFGFPYQGFASQAGSKNTIEYHLFSALTRSHLIGDIEHADYSRCGRTDKGVSAAGNAIALNVRTSRNPNDTSTLSKPELPYLSILNRLLPDDIRVLAWAPVNSDFSARFSCKHRVYKYFIPSLNLDIDRIREALKKLVGTHDFRNFCKLDPSKNIVTYDRTIFEASIEPASEGFPNSSQSHAYSFNSSPSSLLTTSYSSFHVITIRGTAFLWHQIRCIVAVLLHVGQRLESPDIVDKLLDITTCDSKPQFEMASEKGLVLWNCEFEEEDVQWRYWDGDSHLQKKNCGDSELNQPLEEKELLPNSGVNSSSVETTTEIENADQLADKPRKKQKPQPLPHPYSNISHLTKHLITLYHDTRTRSLVMDQLIKDVLQYPLPQVNSQTDSNGKLQSEVTEDITTLSNVYTTPHIDSSFWYSSSHHLIWNLEDNALVPVWTTMAAAAGQKGKGRYTELMKRPRGDSVDVKKQKWAEKQKAKQKNDAGA